MKKYISVLVLSFVVYISTSAVFAEEIVGFVSAPVWFSGTPTQGVPVEVNTVIYNGRDGTLSATVQFLDGKNMLGEKTVTVPAKTAFHTKIVWLPTPGAHAISAQIVKATINQNNIISNIVPDNNASEPVSMTIVPKETTAPSTTAKTNEMAAADTSFNTSSVESPLVQSLTGSFSEIITKTITSLSSAIGALFEKKSEADVPEKQTTSTLGSETTDLHTADKNKTADSSTNTQALVGEKKESSGADSLSGTLFTTVDAVRSSLADGVKQAALKAEESVLANNSKMEAQKQARVEKKLDIDAQDQAVPSVQESADTLGTGTGSQISVYAYKTLSFILDTPTVFYSVIVVFVLFLFSFIFNRFREDN